jgi:serine/threonine protein kinase
MLRDRHVVEKVIDSLRNIGNFELSPLREGEHGACYRATDAARRIAVSIRTEWPGDFPNPEERLRKLLAQARSAQALDQTNVAKVIGSGELEGAFFIVSSFSDGRSLRDILQSGDTLNTWDLIDFARQTCVGLESAHARGLVHHALHPSNVVLQFDASTKILDAGFYRANDPAVDPFHIGCAYLAPEQLQGQPADRQTNFYSVAVMLYEIATGHRPFLGDNWETLIAGTQRPLVEPIELNPSIPPGVNAVLVKALSLDRSTRFSTGPDLVRALEDYKAFGKAAAPTVAPIPAPPKISSASGAAVAPAPARNPYTTPTSETRRPPSLAEANLQTSIGVAKPAILDLQEQVQWKPSASSAPAAPKSEAPAEAGTPEPYVPSKKEISREAALLLAEQTRKRATKGIKKIDPWVAGLSFLGIVLACIIGRSIALSFSGPRTGSSTVVQNTPAPTPISAPEPAPTPVVEQVAAAQPAIEDPPVVAVVAAPEFTNTSLKAARRSGRKSARPVAVNAARALPAANANLPGTGSVMISTVPSGAQVLVDNKSDQSVITPQTVFSLAPGLHTLTISKDGYTAAARTVQITAGAQSNLVVQLELPTGSLTVASNPSAAYIVIDGASTGHMTPAQISVAPGNHTLTLRKMGYLDATDAISVKAGEQQSRSLSLLTAGSTPEIRVAQTSGVRKLFGSKVSGVRLAVRTNPPGANVVINGQSVPKTTPVEFGLNPGSYEMEVSLQGYQGIRKIITVEAGKPLNFDLNLQQ